MQAQTLVPAEIKRILGKEKYQLVGRHSAVKKCRWLHNSLVQGRNCYKQKFFGIKTWRCLQMTPAVAYCTMRCQYCWRVQPDDIDITFNETEMPSWDDPAAIVEASIQAQHRILSGYKAHPKTDPEKYREALTPRHAAISLAGEPTLYPEIGGLVSEFHKRGFTTFIVTNGTVPEAIEALDEEPTQLYVSVCAPDEKTFEDICRPQIPNAWKDLNKTLDLLQSLRCPTVMRLTMVRGLNMKNPEGYAELAKRGNPTYIEPKGYVHVGMSRKRLEFLNMPSHRDVRKFAEELSDVTGYRILDESVDSRVVLLSRLEKPIKLA